MNRLTYGSVCSGIEAASVAWHGLGWKPAWFAEIEAFPSAVLAHHFPSVPNLGDMTAIADRVRSGEIAAPDILVGGTPCQAFSVAGARAGLSDARGQLTLSYVDLANAIDSARAVLGQQPSIIVWENVPGVLSSKDNAFGCFLGARAGEDCELQPPGKRWEDAGCVYGPSRTIAWRVLDAQYFGVAQRRRRVFVVASAREGLDPTSVLFEREGVRRDTAPSRESPPDIAGTLDASLERSRGAGTNPGAVVAAVKSPNHWDGDYAHPTLSQSHNTGGIGASNQEVFSQRGAGLVPVGYRMVAFGEYSDDGTASTMKARDYKDATDLVVSVHGTQDPLVLDNLSFPLGRNNGQENAIAYGIPGNWIGRAPENGGNATEPHHNLSPCLTTADRHGVAYDLQVRRLTPRECERLQGFPDDWTAVPYGRATKPEKMDADFAKYLMRGGVMTFEQCLQAAADGPRYKALGNSMAVPCMEFIGRRIDHHLTHPEELI